MSRKPKPQSDDPEQSKRFTNMAREVAAEQPSPDFERVFHKVAKQPKGAPKANEKEESGAAPSRRSSRKDRS